MDNFKNSAEEFQINGKDIHKKAQVSNGQNFSYQRDSYENKDRKMNN